MAGAFVAGLDAGLLYNTFPKMADQWVSYFFILTYCFCSLKKLSIFKNKIMISYFFVLLNINEIKMVNLFFFLQY
jgi:heme A synthase